MIGAGVGGEGCRRSSPHDQLFVGVMLIGNIADDLLDQVLDRHESVGAAIFVDDDRQMDVASTAS